MRIPALLVLPLLLIACSSKEPESGKPFSEINEEVSFHFTGTEPFWAGTIRDTRMQYETPETPEGQSISVERFAGRGGMSWSGMLGDAQLTLAATPGKCSDGMSDRQYPYIVTLKIGDENLSGCGWSDKRPYQDAQSSGQ